MKGETVILELHKSELSFLRKLGSGIFEEAEVVRAILLAGMTLGVDVNGVDSEEMLTQRVKCALKKEKGGV
jgi:hypothetical protein